MNRTGSMTAIHECWDSLGRIKLLQLSQWHRAKGMEECSYSKGRQRWYQATLFHWRWWWAPHFHVVTMDVGWTLPDGETHISMEQQGSIQISCLLFLLQLENLLCISLWLQHVLGMGGLKDLFTNNGSREVSWDHLLWLHKQSHLIAANVICTIHYLCLYT